MRNLLEETHEAMAEQGLSQDDIHWIGSEDGRLALTWEEFEEEANREYDPEEGPPRVAPDLVVVFHDGSWLAREFDDWEEWWAYRSTPFLQFNYGKPASLFSFRKMQGEQGEQDA